MEMCLSVSRVLTLGEEITQKLDSPSPNLQDHSCGLSQKSKTIEVVCIKLESTFRHDAMSSLYLSAHRFSVPKYVCKTSFDSVLFYTFVLSSRECLRILFLVRYVSLFQR